MAGPDVMCDRAGDVLRVIGAWNAVVPCAPLSSETADRVITEQLAFFRSHASGERPVLEWKVYSHDLPTDLGARLAAAGFAPDEPETLMIFDLNAEMDGAEPLSGVEIRRVTDIRTLTDGMEAARIAFGRDEVWQAARVTEYGGRLNDPTMTFYVAYANGRPVASGRAEFPRGRSFAGLWGGGTIREYRGRGIYRALVHARAAEARRKGYPYLRVDARDTSRPILERLGFMPLTHIREWRLGL